MDDGYSVPQFVGDLREIASQEFDDRDIIRRVRPLAKRLALNRDGWLTAEHRTVDERRGIGVHMLSEEDDHSLAVMAVAWSPGYATPPHDHGTWGVVAGVDCVERNVNWRRLDDGSRPGHAEIVDSNEVAVAAGETVGFMPRDIHSVHNDGDGVTVSLHVYGRHVNHTKRSQFDRATNTMKPFVIAITD